MRWKLAHPFWGSNQRSLDYIPSSITRHVSDHQSKASISIYQGLQTKKLYTKMTKNMNWIYPMPAILNFTICGKTVSFTAWHTAEMDSAQNFHVETTNEVLFLKNAYRSLSRAIFHFFVLTIMMPDKMARFLSWTMFADKPIWINACGDRIIIRPKV